MDFNFSLELFYQDFISDVYTHPYQWVDIDYSTIFQNAFLTIVERELCLRGYGRLGSLPIGS
jgi:hypothetical protein